jgi:hypothetical protein
MGFFHGGARLGPSVRESLVVTPREFTRLIAGTLRSVRGPGDSDTYQPGMTDRVGVSTLEKLSARVRASPEDAAAHRMLAIAHLSAGNAKSAARHLVIAADILLRLCADARTLRATLRAHLELKLLGVILVPHYLRLGKARIVHRLLMEVLLVW